jgi:cysteine synthase
MTNSRQDRLLDSVLGAIGNAPLVELSRITRGLEGRILAKLEYLNPGFSKKDRIALQMIEEAEANGELRPGQIVVELTSGNPITPEHASRQSDRSVTL